MIRISAIVDLKVYEFDHWKAYRGQLRVAGSDLAINEFDDLKVYSI